MCSGCHKVYVEGEVSEEAHTVIALRGDRLREVRKQQGLSAHDLAELSGVTARHIWRLEAGKRPNVAAATLGRLAVVLGVSLEYLLGVTDDPVSMMWPGDGNIPLVQAAAPAGESQSPLPLVRVAVPAGESQPPMPAVQAAVPAGESQPPLPVVQAAVPSGESQRPTPIVQGDEAIRERRDRVIAFFRFYPEATNEEAADVLGVPYSTTRKDIAALKRKGRLRREGRTMRVFPSD
jgi:transcriptional regulator with XRE-family HTH domain